MKSIITIRCPECRGTLEIDVVHEKVIAHKRFVDADAPEADKAALFDDVMRRVSEREGETERAFDRAQRQVRNHDERLDALFGDVKKKIEEEKKKGPSKQDDRDLFWD